MMELSTRQSDTTKTMMAVSRPHAGKIIASSWLPVGKGVSSCCLAAHVTSPATKTVAQ